MNRKKFAIFLVSSLFHDRISTGTRGPIENTVML